jgi:KUP system potassium uptake protein
VGKKIKTKKIKIITCYFYQRNYRRNKFIRSSAVVVSLMSVWYYGESKKQAFELENKVSLDSLLSLGIARVPGICLVCSHVTSGVPPMFAHFVTNFPAFHQILIFVTVQFLMIPKVPVIDRFHVSRIGPPDVPLFRCIVR